MYSMCVCIYIYMFSRSKNCLYKSVCCSSVTHIIILPPTLVGQIADTFGNTVLINIGHN